MISIFARARRSLGPVALIFLWSLSARALDVVSFVDAKCAARTGVVIGLGESSYEILRLDGVADSIPFADVTAVAVFKVRINPIPAFHDDPRLRERLRDIYTGDSENPRFRAWPVGFLDNLVFFLDVAGKEQIVELSKITNIRPAGGPMPDKPVASQPEKFRLADLPLDCDLEKSGLQPHQFYVDPIRIQDWRATLQSGYDRLQSYEERTYFYARPLLFPTATRLALLDGFPQETPFVTVPFKLQWASGEPYRFQSLNQLGSELYEMSPTFQPPFSFSSDVKSHFFHASFLLNLLAPTAGSSYLGRVLTIEEKDLNRAHYSVTYNYMALMGFDYQQWSLSFGTAFPLFLLHDHLFLREIKSSSLSPFYRLRWQGRKLSLALLYSKTRKRVSAPTEDDVTLPTFGGLQISDISRIELDNEWLKGAAAYTINDMFEVRGGAQRLQTSYRENYSGVPQTFSIARNSLFAELRLNFGDYITARGFMVQSQTAGTSATILGENAIWLDDSKFGGGIEFIF